MNTVELENIVLKNMKIKIIYLTNLSGQVGGGVYCVVVSG